MKSRPAGNDLSNALTGKWGRWLILVAMTLTMLQSGSLVHAGGILYFVNTTSDTVVPGACANGSAGCSLRGAIQAANSHPGMTMELNQCHGHA